MEQLTTLLDHIDAVKERTKAYLSNEIDFDLAAQDHEALQLAESKLRRGVLRTLLNNVENNQKGIILVAYAEYASDAWKQYIQIVEEREAEDFWYWLEEIFIVSETMLPEVYQIVTTVLPIVEEHVDLEIDAWIDETPYPSIVHLTKVVKHTQFEILGLQEQENFEAVATRAKELLDTISMAQQLPTNDLVAKTAQRRQSPSESFAPMPYELLETPGKEVTITFECPDIAHAEFLLKKLGMYALGPSERSEANGKDQNKSSQELRW